MRWCVLVMMMAAVAEAEVIVDEDPAATCRAAHASGTAACPRHVVRQGDRIELRTKIVWEIDKAIIRRSSMVVVQELARYLNERPEIELVEIQGHSGFEESYGAPLSDRRARALLAALVHFGVAPGRLASNGYGESVPLVLPKTRADRVKNTRMELVIRKRSGRL